MQDLSNTPAAPSSVAEYIDALGSRNLADRSGRGMSSVSHWRVTGLFPARLFALVRTMCGEKDLPLPGEELFSFDRDAAHAIPPSRDAS